MSSIITSEAISFYCTTYINGSPLNMVKARNGGEERLHLISYDTTNFKPTYFGYDLHLTQKQKFS